MTTGAFRGLPSSGWTPREARARRLRPVDAPTDRKEVSPTDDGRQIATSPPRDFPLSGTRAVRLGPVYTRASSRWCSNPGERWGWCQGQRGRQGPALTSTVRPKGYTSRIEAAGTRQPKDATSSRTRSPEWRANPAADRQDLRETRAPACTGKCAQRLPLPAPNTELWEGRNGTQANAVRERYLRLTW